LATNHFWSPDLVNKTGSKNQIIDQIEDPFTRPIIMCGKHCTLSFPILNQKLHH